MPTRPRRDTRDPRRARDRPRVRPGPSVRRASPGRADWRAWREVCDQEQGGLNIAIAAGSRPDVKSDLYKAKKYALRETIYFNPDGPFHGKCAYCEQNIFRNQHGDIEHFRPHGRVTAEDNLPVRVAIDGEEVVHPGYYWLVYMWQNLLPACVLCNQSSTIHSAGRRIGKADRFPVRGVRAVKPGEEEQEEPLLLHPVFDEPEEHLILNDMCSFDYLDDRGSACIDIFGLNERDLPNARMEIYLNVRQQVGLLIQAVNQADLRQQCQSLSAKLLRLKNGWGAHTAAARKAIRDGFAEAERLKREILDEPTSIQ